MYTRPLPLLVLAAAAATLSSCCAIEAEFGVSPSGTCDEPLEQDAYICRGKSFTLCWATTRADSVSIDEIGTVNRSGKTSVALLASKDYVLRAKNAFCDTSRTVTVHVFKPMKDLEARPPAGDGRAAIVPDRATTQFLVTWPNPRCASNCLEQAGTGVLHADNRNTWRTIWDAAIAPATTPCETC